MDILEISDVAKSFGNVKVIDRLSFSVPEHSVFGFIGQNGAGKTTTMKMVLGLLKTDAGEISVNGEKVSFGQTATNRFIGYLPDVPEFYGFMTPAEYLLMCGQITGMGKKESRENAEELLKLVGLKNADKRIQGFSRGMKQRLGIAQALLNSPKLLICDEPTSALDPVGRKEILEILHSVREHTTVIFSTHILSDVERICDRVAFLHKGKIALEGRIDKLQDLRKGDRTELEFCTPQDAGRFASLLEGCVRLDPVKIRIINKKESDMVGILSILAQNKIPVRRLERLEPTLEELFMEVVA